MSFKNTLIKAGRKVSKHSPAIYTGIGVAGLGATAYLAYKARPKVEAVVEEIERAREAGEDVSKRKVVVDLTEALYIPVAVGAASVASILMAHKIQNRRIKTLAGALAAQQAQNIYFEQKYKKKHGQEEYEKFVTPTDDVEEQVTGKNGKATTKVKEVKKEIDHTIGQWYDDSSEYAADDHAYNVAYIASVNERMQTLLFQRGSLLLNEVREALGFERIRNGALLGWTTADTFDIEKIVTNLGDEDMGELKEQIYVTWTKPRYIYDDVDFNGRYSAY